MQELNDPVKAKAYIDVALEEYQSDNDEALLLALRDVVEAQGGWATDQGNPQLLSLTAVLRELGLRLAVEVSDPVAV